MTLAVLAANTIFKQGDGATPTEVFTEVPEVLSIGTVGEQAELVDVTGLNPPNKTREFISGLKEGDDREITMNRIDGDAQQDLLRTSAQAGDTVNFQILFSNAEVATFALALQGWRIDATDPAVQVKAIVTAKQTGAVVWT